MKVLVLSLLPLALILGGAFLGWLARWYHHGGRCGPGGLAQGVPALDGTGENALSYGQDRSSVSKSGALATDTGVNTRASDASASDRATPSGFTSSAGSTDAGTGTGSTVSDAVSAVKDKAANAVDSAKASLATARDGYAEGRNPGDAPADGSAVAKIGAAAGGAVSTVQDTAAKAADGLKSAVAPLTDGTAKAKVADVAGSVADTVKGAASDVADVTRSSAAALKDGYAEGRTAGDAPADGSAAARIGAVAGSAVSTVQDTAAKAAEGAKSVAAPLTDGTAKAKVADVAGSVADTVKDAASGAVDATKSSTAALKGGYAEGKAVGETPDAPADGSVAAKIGAAVGGAVSTVQDGAAKAADGAKSAAAPLTDGTAKAKVADVAGSVADTVKDAASGAVDATKSSTAALKDGYVEGKAVGETPDAPADGSVAAKIGAAVGGVAASAKTAVSGIAGATIGQEDGHKAVGDETSAKDDTAMMRARFATLADEAAGDEVTNGAHAGVIDIPDTLSDVEREAERLIESGETLGKPAGALAAPDADRAADDLKLISGIGPKIEETLNGEGIYYFDQIADFGARDLAWADRTLGFRGRAVRDRWIPQARGLAAQRERTGLGATVSYLGDEGASGNAAVNTRLRLAEAEALRLIERDGGYAATDQNRPSMLMRDGPVGGKPDDLKRIKGIGEKMESVLNSIGVYYFRQIASFSAMDIAWIDSKLSFKGRIIRDRWVPQAEKFEKNRNA